jgi:hypothetical protein
VGSEVHRRPRATWPGPTSLARRHLVSAANLEHVAEIDAEGGTAPVPAPAPKP